MQMQIIETVYLTFHDNITPQTVNCFMDICNKVIQQYKPKQIYILFSSEGGLVSSGCTLYNYLRGLPQKIIMHNTGSVSSISIAVFLGGDVRYASPASTFLLHGILWNFFKTQSLTYSQMQENISRFDADENLAAQIIGERTNLTAQEVRDLFRQGQSKNPSFALEKEIIQEIAYLWS